MSVSQVATVSSEPYLPGNWTIDPIHSYVGFSIKHLMAIRIRGQFDVTGEILVGERIEDSVVNASVDVGSIHTNNEQRNELLRAELFDVRHHPRIDFVSTGFHETDDTLLVDGDLTMVGVTKGITLAAAPPAFEGPNPEGVMVIDLSARGSINRTDFGLDFNHPTLGGLMLGEQVGLVLEIEALLNEAT